MLRRSKRDHLARRTRGDVPPGSFTSYRQKRRKKTTLIVSVLVLLLLSIPGYLIYRSWRAYTHVIQQHSGVSTTALQKKAPEIGDVHREGDGRVNILLLGIGDSDHAGSLLTDTMLVASIDPVNKDIALLSLPRDLYVSIPGHGYDKINAAHVYGELAKSGNGANVSKTVVGQVLDVPIHYFMRVDFTGFKRAIDTVGGIQLIVPTNLYDSEYPCDRDEHYACGFSIAAGQHKLNGSLALKYVRCRKGNCGNDFGRAERQQAVMLALHEKALSLSTVSNPAKLGSLIDTIGDHLRTDLSLEEMQRLVEVIREIDRTQIVSKVIDNDTSNLVRTSTINGASVVIPNDGIDKYQAIQDLTHSLFVDNFLVKENATVHIIDRTGRASVAAELAERLKTYHYRLADTQTDSVQAETRLLDYANQGKPYTRRYLESRLGVTASVPSGDAPAGVDIQIILGSDFQGTNL